MCLEFLIFYSRSPFVFNFEKPSAKEIFQVILLEPEKYKEKHPLKNVRDNKYIQLEIVVLITLPATTVVYIAVLITIKSYFIYKLMVLHSMSN